MAKRLWGILTDALGFMGLVALGGYLGYAIFYFVRAVVR